MENQKNTPYLVTRKDDTDGGWLDATLTSWDARRLPGERVQIHYAETEYTYSVWFLGNEVKRVARIRGIDIFIDESMYEGLNPSSWLTVAVVACKQSVVICQATDHCNRPGVRKYSVRATPTIRYLCMWVDDHMDLLLRVCDPDATEDDHAAMSAAVADIADLDDRDTVKMYDPDKYFALYTGDTGWNDMPRAEQEELISEFSDFRTGFWALGGVLA
jgi:hypothetical protein